MTSWDITSLTALKDCVRDLEPQMRGAIGLSGPLGAGKTEFVRCVAKLYGCDAQVTSPTFALENIYSGKNLGGKPLTIHHWDLYRLKGAKAPLELMELTGKSDALILIEWPELCNGVTEILDGCVTIEHTENDQRKLTFLPTLLQPPPL